MRDYKKDRMANFFSSSLHIKQVKIKGKKGKIDEESKPSRNIFNDFP